MSRRRRRRKPPGEVQINLAAMLDMAFQLLAFFIMTFRPAPIEGHFQLRMPPPGQMVAAPVAASTTPSDGVAAPSFVETLDLFVKADNTGQVTTVSVGQQEVVSGRLNEAAVQQLNAHLRGLFTIQAVPFDRIQVHADRRLHYQELMKIVDVCTRQTLPDGTQMRQIGFTELLDPAKAAEPVSP
ncbi:MAG: biopolymer transporter ExbD [Planctomycetaceae bacterium]